MDADRAVERAVVALMACLPLLPAGPAYLDLDPGAVLDVALGALVLLACWTGLRRLRGAPSRPQSARLRVDPIFAAWLVFAATVTGAAVVGLLTDNDVTSPVFRGQLAGLWRLLWPVDRVWDPLQPLYVWITFMEGLLAYASLRVICTSAPCPARRARAAMRGWWYGFGAVALFAILQYLTRFRLDPFWVAVNPELTRSHSTLDDPNALGSYLLLGIFLSAGYFVVADGKRRRTVSLLFVAMGGGALLASGSRAAIVAAVVAGLMALAAGRPSGSTNAVRRWPQRTARWLLIGGLAVIVVSVGARGLVDPDPRGYRPDSVVGALASSLDPRVPLADVLERRQVWWASALEMGRDHPLVGVGLGRYPRLLASRSDSSGPSLDAHDLFLQLFAEMGLPGLIAFVALLGVIFASLARLRRTSDRDGRVLASAVLFGSVAYVVTLATGHPLLLPSGQILWATLLGAVTVAGGGATGARAEAAGHAPGSEAGSSSRSGPWRRPAVVALICVGVIGFYTVGALSVAATPVGGPWGYSHGLYPLETGPRPFRWTSGRALIQLQVPPDAVSLQLEMAVSPALRDGRPTAIRVFVRDPAGGDSTAEPRDVYFRRVTAPTMLTATVPLAADATAEREILVGILVRPTFVPARLDGGSDERELGVQLLGLRFATGS